MHRAAWPGAVLVQERGGGGMLGLCSVWMLEAQLLLMTDDVTKAPISP